MIQSSVIKTSLGGGLAFIPFTCGAHLIAWNLIDPSVLSLVSSWADELEFSLVSCITNQVKQSRLWESSTVWDGWSWNSDGYVYPFHPYNKWVKIFGELIHYWIASEEDPKVFTSLMGSQSHSYPRGQGHEKDYLDELIGNLQTYELRRNFQQKEEIKKDRGIALKVMEEDNSNLDVCLLYTSPSPRD